MKVTAGAALSDSERVLDARKVVHVRVRVVSCKRGRMKSRHGRCEVARQHSALSSANQIAEENDEAEKFST